MIFFFFSAQIALKLNWVLLEDVLTLSSQKKGMWGKKKHQTDWCLIIKASLYLFVQHKMTI